MSATLLDLDLDTQDLDQGKILHAYSKFDIMLSDLNVGEPVKAFCGYVPKKGIRSPEPFLRDYPRCAVCIDYIVARDSQKLHTL